MLRMKQISAFKVFMEEMRMKKGNHCTKCGYPTPKEHLMDGLCVLCRETYLIVDICRLTQIKAKRGGIQ